MTSKQVDEYGSTKLGLHHLAILKEISNTDVLEDEVSDVDVLDNVSSASNQSNKVLQWNFPQIGHTFKEVIEKFIEEMDEESLMSLCNKLPTFAGCWFECLYFKHLRRSDKIHVYYTTVHDPTRKTLELTYSQVDAMVDCSNLQRGILYESKAYYPIVDAIGCLTDNDGEHWLVFIQVYFQNMKITKENSATCLKTLVMYVLIGHITLTTEKPMI